ncbi:MAG: MFS transporter, partial [Candidatus Eremiobacteraeota bacterium]|nr:MFS transporter [Candidatus Eremiobacteraeota bacterium]
FNYQWAIATAGVATIVASSIASALYREPVELRGERTSLAAMFAEMVQMARDVRLVLITLTSMALVCVQMVLMAFLTLTLVHEAGLSVAMAVAMFTVSQVAAVGGRLSWGWISDRIFHGSRALPLVVVCVATALVAFGVAAITPRFSLAILAMLAIVLGFAAEGWFGVAVIAFAEIGGEEHSGSALGVALTWVFFAAFVAPTLFGALVEVHGYPFAWRALGVLALVGVVPALLASAMMRRFSLETA